MNSKFTKWWQDNPDKAEEIRSRRREKYANNTKVRDKELERKRKDYLRSKTSSTKRFPKPKLHWFKDRLIELWSVGATAEFLGVHKRTLSGLELKGTIPKNRLVDDNGRRWWPETYVKWLKPYFSERQTEKLTAQEFSLRVWNDWKLALEQDQIPNIAEDSK